MSRINVTRRVLMTHALAPFAEAALITSISDRKNIRATYNTSLTATHECIRAERNKRIEQFESNNIIAQPFGPVTRVPHAIVL